MRFARSVAEGVIGIIVFLFLLCVMANIIADRCSMNLDSTDLTWEEVQANIKQKGE